MTMCVKFVFGCAENNYITQHYMLLFLTVVDLALSAFLCMSDSTKY